MADGLNFTMGDFPPGAIEYSSTEAMPSSSEFPLPSVLMSGIMVLGQMIWFRLSSKWGTVNGSRSKAEISDCSEELFSRQKQQIRPLIKSI
ncbi:LOW QUALITY PROTEIN: uncharacterized protein Dyak_GE28631 [Drosophila yakuba]|uniref:Uncharacterized protein n=1 Tax=Drosophila yakuba TaxID=7245 RepID=A0A0R1DYJ1_DROYA|nr:LOW QUALITY PROTEIN: uncharacterized protein Dyak_GE28631 [Drosophila yakuba]